ncbi:protein javelin [Drosophila erecta]|uniref:Protein javelin n=1 Tax=Drosophila erecta TaxID=7220 RepID=B3NGI9_DROER|nr:protein javelin [Drosophila erecta]XP_026832195.1 protein javelin [Drosophila erecta]XP_026832196.1 protein javelin [Drosophila erecta]EDV51155.2 uncharacterized protein Dere_GG14055 [Drosophila erecta]
MGNGYFRTSQTSSSSRQREKRGKDSYSYQHNYVDRVRLEDTTGGHYHSSQHQQTTHDPRCPQLRAAGWRHTHKSVSHLDLATSCHDAAGTGLGRHSQQLHHHHANQVNPHHQQQSHHHLQHSSSNSNSHHQHAQPHWTQCRVGGAGSGNGQLRNARSLDYTQLEREENALDIAEFYWRFDAEAPLDQVDSYAVLPIDDNFEPSAATPTAVGAKEAATTCTTTVATKANGGATNTTTTTTTTTTATSVAANALLDILGSESCSLRRSRSLAVIREETFSDLQIGSANSSRRRSQLIPRARLVNRGFFRESPRLNGKPHQTTLLGEQPVDQPTADDTQSQRSNSGTCDSHQQQQQQQQQQHQQQQHQPQQHQQQQHRRLSRESRDFDVYYDNLKRLDALALNLSEQLHPWHNDKSDLESLNSDYFKNSLHQNHLDQQQPSSLEFEALEQVAASLLKERPRIYQSRRQQQSRNNHHSNCLQRHLDTGGESCPEHSQSSVFPETTTSNSDDQTDSPSLSEQEYDLTHIEEIYQQGNNGEECYEIISLTTTTRTRFESSEEGEEEQAGEEVVDSLTTPTEPQTSDSESTLRQNHNEQLDKLIAYDSVYLSSEDSSDCTLVGECCESFEQRTFTSCGESGELETRSLLHISIEDTVYEPQAKQHKKATNQEDQPAPLLATTAKVEAQIFTQVLKVEHTPKPKILAVVEKRKLKQEEVKQQPPELKRQATDSFVVTANKSNLAENQYHSLPDVNIGVSLKVCENIDKELRSSYNQQRQQQRKEAKKEQQVTRAETYDSIRRFGRAHQKARQREYQEREREREKEASAVLQEKDKEREKEKPKINKEFSAQERQIEAKGTTKSQAIIKEIERISRKDEAEDDEEEEPLPPPPPPLTEESHLEHSAADVEEEDNLSVSISQPEQPKEAPVIEVANFSRLIERRAQEIRERQEQIKPSFQIIVTDAQNNIIQKEAIQENKETSQRIKPKPSTKTNSNSNSNPTCNLIQRPLRRSVSSSSGKPLEHRILSTGAPIYKARPVRVLPASSSDSSFSRGKMSRPQILHVVDGRGGVAGGGAGGTLRRRSSGRSIASTISSPGGEVANEYLQKVDAVRCYWNKLAGNEPETLKTEQPAKETQPGIHFQLGGETTTQGTDKSPVGNDFCSMMPHPSIEIVELGEGAQKATIVKAAPEQEDDPDEDQDQFDHIRYKVLKSQQLIRNNFLSSRNKKEAQFDGLIQYLQEYSFQELLSNNNVVIVEPVRTKIERPLQVGITSGSTTTPTSVPPPKPPRVVNASASQPRKTRQRQMGGAAAKRHFFYQPVRVNRELYEDELPDPDTVRNVRRFFEQNVLPTPGQGLLVQSQQKFGGSACQLSPKSRRARGYRYLTIDTSYGGAEEQPKGMEMLEEHKAKHWDNASLSSGISSGDLSSPCGEYHHQESPVMACKDVHVQDVVRRHNSNAANAKARAKFASRRTWCMGAGGPGANESLYRQIYENNLENSEQQENEEHLEEEDDEQDDQYEDDVEQDMCENYYVSNDVLAKIRECGSTVTYYGGRVLEKTATSSTVPSTKTTQPMTGSATRSRIRQIEACNVCLPSERCEHRLQTKQAAAEQQQDSYQGIKFKLVKSNSCSSRLELAGTGEDEVTADSEVVRKMVHHFEANRTTASNDVQVTINSQSQITSAKKEPEEDVLRRQVTVNNHINVLGDTMPQESQEPQDPQEWPENFNGRPEENGYGVVETVPTYESQAMNIRLDSSENKNILQTAAATAVANKVCRNKNVDLAYTLVKTTTNPPKGKPIEAPRQKIGKQLREVEENAEKAAVTKAAIKLTKAAPSQIIVPVDIHSQASIVTHTAPIPERRLSSASSSNSVVDKSVVRHYVANDRSIYERRKYDEIEFEEFEVYDPSKEPPPQVEEAPEKVPTDAELYDSLDDKM